MRSRLEVSVVAGLVIAMLGCTPTEDLESPLLEPLRPPMVFVESRKLAMPNAGPGNRFVSGWLFDEVPEGVSITPAAGIARLEFIQLRRRARALTLVTRGAASDIEVRAMIGARPLETETSSAGIEISLPADLALGRNVIDLELAGRTGVRFSGVTLSAAARTGEVSVEFNDVVQLPWSVVEFVRWVEAGAILLGEFVPPSNATPNQNFTLRLKRGGGEPETVIEMGPSDGIVDIRVPLRMSAGPVRVQLVAEGRGAAGRWRGMRLRNQKRVSKAAVVGSLKPPKIVVVYVLDALRGDVVGHLGSNLSATPCIDRLAAEGAVFANHLSVAPNTGPATSSLFTGYGFLRGRSIPDDVPTLAEDFAAAGYRTVAISSNPHLSPSFGLTRGFTDVLFEPIDEDFEADDDHDPIVNDSAERVHAAALKWLGDQNADDKAFLYLHTLNPHNPYTPPEPFPSLFLQSGGSIIDAGTKTLADIRDLELAVTPEDEQRIREWYAAGVAYNDAALCTFVGELERRFDDEFLLVVTSDHGEELFDHGGVLHGYTLYDELLHVPLVMWWPAHIRPIRIERASDTLDLTTTLRALTTTGPAERHERGADLWAAIAGDVDAGNERALHFATAPGLRRAAMVRSDRWKLVLAPRPRYDWGMGKGRGRSHDAEYLFNLIDDPEETVNRAGAESLEVDWLRSQLQGWLGYWEARQPERDDKRLDEATRRRLEALGYAD